MCCGAGFSFAHFDCGLARRRRRHCVLLRRIWRRRGRGERSRSQATNSSHRDLAEIEPAHQSLEQLRVSQRPRLRTVRLQAMGEGSAPVRRHRHRRSEVVAGRLRPRRNDSRRRPPRSRSRKTATSTRRRGSHAEALHRNRARTKAVTGKCWNSTSRSPTARIYARSTRKASASTSPAPSTQNSSRSFVAVQVGEFRSRHCSPSRAMPR